MVNLISNSIAAVSENKRATASMIASATRHEGEQQWRQSRTGGRSSPPGSFMAQIASKALAEKKRLNRLSQAAPPSPKNRAPGKGSQLYAEAGHEEEGDEEDDDDDGLGPWWMLNPNSKTRELPSRSPRAPPPLQRPDGARAEAGGAGCRPPPPPRRRQASRGIS